MSDPFRYHPTLRALIRNPMTSSMRDFSMRKIQEKNPGVDFSRFLISVEQREAGRRAFLEGRRDTPLWIFAYGSLMWDPAIRFDEVRRGYIATHARRFILRDTLGGRGNMDAPGLMAALDEGPGCHGLVFRIPTDLIEDETYRLWARERVGHAYRETFLPVDTDHGAIEAVAFVAEHKAEVIDTDIPREKQIEYLATGKGVLGSSIEYIRNLDAGLKELKVDDPELSALLADAEKYRRGLESAR